MRREPRKRNERRNKQYAADADCADQESDDPGCKEELRAFEAQRPRLICLLARDECRQGTRDNFVD